MGTNYVIRQFLYFVSEWEQIKFDSNFKLSIVSIALVAAW